MHSTSRSQRKRTGSSKTVKLEAVPEDAKPKYPRLPKRPDGEPWSPATRARWKAVWTGTVGVQTFEPSDFHPLVDLADLWQRREFARNNREASDLSREIRQQESRWGLDARSRQALKYEVVKADESEDRRRRRKRPSLVTETNVGESTPAAELTQSEILARIRPA